MKRNPKPTDRVRRKRVRCASRIVQLSPDNDVLLAAAEAMRPPDVFWSDAFDDIDHVKQAVEFDHA